METDLLKDTLRTQVSKHFQGERTGLCKQETKWHWTFQQELEDSGASLQDSEGKLFPA